MAKQSKIADMDTIKLLEKRLKHQKSEVAEAKKNLGKDGFTKSYLNRMAGNVKQTEVLLRKYKNNRALRGVGSIMLEEKKIGKVKLRFFQIEDRTGTHYQTKVYKSNRLWKMTEYVENYREALSNFFEICDYYEEE